MVSVGRTNIDIDDELIARVMRIHCLRTKREAVDFALRKVDVPPMSREELLALRGMGWDGDDVGHEQPPAVRTWLDRGR